MSSNPSSKTEKSPTGPAPTIATSVEMTSLIASALLPGRRHDQSVQRLADLDLARKPRVRTHLEGEVEHVLLHLGGLADGLGPFLRDIDVARRAGARAATFGFDPRNGIAQRRLHHRRADLRLDGARLPGCVDK